jgi:hypothetical protein
MADFLDEKRREINDRIAELKPLFAEYKALQQAAVALGGVDGTRSTTTSAPTRRGPGRPPGSKSRTTTRRRTGGRGTQAASAKGASPRTATTSRRRAGRRKGTGERAAQALEFVADQPGITIAELAAKMGIKQNYLYRVMPGLEQEAKVEKQGRGWHPKAAAV